LPELQTAIDNRIAETLDIEQAEARLGTEPVLEGEHPSLADSTPADRLQHIQDMLMQGYSNDEIMALHPEVTEQDIITAGAEAAANN
jgi:hypothetical protein